MYLPFFFNYCQLELVQSREALELFLSKNTESVYERPFMWKAFHLVSEMMNGKVGVNKSTRIRVKNGEEWFMKELSRRSTTTTIIHFERK